MGRVNHVKLAVLQALKRLTGKRAAAVITTTPQGEFLDVIIPARLTHLVPQSVAVRSEWSRGRRVVTMSVRGTWLYSEIAEQGLVSGVKRLSARARRLHRSAVL